MKIQVLLFGIIADLIGETSIDLNLKDAASIKDFKEEIILQFPQLKNYTTYAVALNETYAQDDAVIKKEDIIAIIPPVSGG